jgi:hypothetical protein
MHNWARCLNIVKAYRDEKANFDIGELDKGFQNLDFSKIQRIAHHRIGRTCRRTLSIVVEPILAFDPLPTSIGFSLRSDPIPSSLTGQLRLHPASACSD